jgi:hypothetical protein
MTVNVSPVRRDRIRFFVEFVLILCVEALIIWALWR